MKNWVKFCIKYNLKVIPLLVCILLSPLYLLVYIGDAFKDFKTDFNLIKNAKKGDY